MHYTYPGGDELSAKIVDEIYEDFDAEDYIYRKMLQWIEFDDGDHALRFTYYRRPANKGDNSWVFAGQNSPLLQKDILESLVKKAIRKGWIKI